MKRFGLQLHRLRDNPEEQRFSDAWMGANEYGKTLDYILDSIQRGLPPKASERDSHVAATVIQWLGSPVGQKFLEDLGYTRERRDG